MEKDVAMSAGQISGYFGDMITPMVLTANGTLVKIVATYFNTKNERRMFAILAAPKYQKKSLKEIASAGIACSSNTMLDYLMTRLLGKKGITPEKINLVEVKSIPIRMQMLMSDQVPAAILPEPLVTLAELKGARVLVDDSGTGMSATVLVFGDQYLAKNPDTVRAFLKAVQKANDFINQNPDQVRPIMNRECKIPEPLQQNFTIPSFPKLNVPRTEEIMDVYKWLRDKNVIKTEMSYGQFVAEGYVQ
jgi:NitT/TauT family transport system substrate-binding protein